MTPATSSVERLDSRISRLRIRGKGITMYLDEAVSAAPRVKAAVGPFLAAASRGEPVVIVRSKSCLLAVIARSASDQSVALLVRHETGLVLAATSVRRLERLDIPRMVASAPDAPVFHVAIDAAENVTTGISAHDRAVTLQRLADPAAGPSWFTRPGHVLPVGVESSAGVIADDASSALAVALLSGEEVPVVGYCGLTSQIDPCELAGPVEGCEVAAALGLSFVAESDLVTALCAQQWRAARGDDGPAVRAFSRSWSHVAAR